jgi:hypothetical protein
MLSISFAWYECFSQTQSRKQERTAYTNTPGPFHPYYPAKGSDCIIRDVPLGRCLFRPFLQRSAFEFMQCPILLLTYLSQKFLYGFDDFNYDLRDHSTKQCDTAYIVSSQSPEQGLHKRSNMNPDNCLKVWRHVASQTKVPNLSI